MVFRFPFAHIPSRLAENRRRGHNVDPVNLRQIRTGRAKQLRALMNTLAHPVVEALCLVGLQRCRPRPTRTPRVFDYFTWHIPLPVSVVPAAVSGLIGDGDCYHFANAFRTDQRKHKAFMPATRIPRSSQ